MKKALRIILPIILAITILFFSIWYLVVYDRAFTRDVLLTFARHSESSGNYNLAAWFYNVAYTQSGNSDQVAIELAQQYKAKGNYTKAEFTLSNAIKDGGGIELYTELCRTYLEQDKLLDAINMLDSISNPTIKAELDTLRPQAPAAAPTPGYYTQYISVTLDTIGGSTIYARADGQYPSITDVAYLEPITLSDGENVVYAVSIAENGLVSPLAIYGYTIGGVVKPLDFADPVIEASVRKQLGVSAAKTLYTNDLWDIKDFNIPADATNYTDLQYMIFLDRLTIANGKCTDFSFISSLKNLSELSVSNTAITQETLNLIASIPTLQKLSLSDCGISGITALSKAGGLISLDLSNNTIRNIEPIKSMLQLQELQLQHNAISDISVLSGLTELKTLDLSYNALTNLMPLSNLTELLWLNADTNAITGLDALQNLTKLSYLSVSGNQITSVEKIKNCTALVELNISSNAIKDISALSALTQMTHFDFSNNQVTKLPAFPKKCELVSINGAYNQLSSISSLAGLHNLNTINMDHNAKISSVKELKDCPALVEVNVYGTKVKKVSELTNLGVVVNYTPT